MKQIALIFDMDGLLFDTENLSTKIWADIFAKHQLKSEESFFLSLRGANEQACIKLFDEHYPNSPVDFKELKREKNQILMAKLLKEGVPVKKDAYELLTYLNENKIPCGLATSTSKNIAEVYLKQTDMLRYFKATIYGDEIKHSKPHPQIFLMCAQKLSVDPSQCLVLEDSQAGLMAAKAADMKAIWIPDGVYFENDAIKADSLIDVISLLQMKEL